MKTAFLFPGQGAQYIGMGREFFEKHDSFRKIFLKANEILGFDLAKLCFEGPETSLTETRICQPAIFTMSFACFEVLKNECPQIHFDGVAGLSLGEFTALTVAGGMSFETGLKVVQARGQYMQQACSERKGTMASILGLEESKIREICQKVAQEAIVTVANVNSPGQVVISGTPEGIQKAVEELKKAGAKRAIELQVSGAFHSPLMASARDRLEQFLKNIEIQTPKTIFVSNVLGKSVSDPSEIKNLLIRQVTDSVLWEQGVKDLIQKGFDTFVEVGCGKVLSGLQRKIAPETKMFHVEDVESLDELKKTLSVVRTA